MYLIYIRRSDILQISFNASKNTNVVQVTLIVQLDAEKVRKCCNPGTICFLSAPKSRIAKILRMMYRIEPVSYRQEYWYAYHNATGFGLVSKGNAGPVLGFEGILERMPSRCLLQTHPNSSFCLCVQSRNARAKRRPLDDERFDQTIYICA